MARSRTGSDEQTVQVAHRLRDGFVAVYVERNSHHDNTAFAETKLLGWLGWEYLARQYLADGLINTDETKEQLMRQIAKLKAKVEKLEAESADKLDA